MAQSERVFQTYTSAQAEFYRKTRGTYNKTLYDFVLDRHVQSGGGLDQLVDVGCGPGSATADLATYFQRAIGVDPGAGMIQAAKEAGGTTRTGADIEYVVGVAEDLDQLEEIALQSTDLITAATCAHWFDMPKFWRAAENVLKPGGSVAIWIKASLLCRMLAISPASYRSFAQGPLFGQSLIVLQIQTPLQQRKCRTSYGSLSSIHLRLSRWKGITSAITCTTG